ncbi:MAG: hypothetical protein ABI945_04080 [Nitrospirales bacterium]
MLTSLIEVSLTDPQFVYEPKYNGIRALIDVEAGTGGVHIVSRLGNDKTIQARIWSAFSNGLRNN